MPQNESSTPAAPPAQTGATGGSGSPNNQTKATVKDRAQAAAKETTGFVRQYGPPTVGVVVIVAVSWVLAGWARRATRAGLTRARFDPTLGKFLSNSVRWVILTFAVLTCMSLFGIEQTSFAAVLGATGLAIGLALQGSLSNFAAGVMLLVFRPFKVGDMVTAAGQFGKVNEIDLFQTSIDTPDGRRLILPNGQIFGSTIENVTHHPRRRVDVPVGVAYDADVDRTREVLERAAREVPGALADPAPDVFLDKLGASSVDWVVRVWATRDDFGRVKQAAVRAVKYALDEAGIGIPFPQTEIWVRSMPGPAAAERPATGLPMLERT